MQVSSYIYHHSNK